MTRALPSLVPYVLHAAPAYVLTCLTPYVLRASCAWYLKCYRASQFPYLKYYCVSRAACFTCFVSYLPACSLYPTCFRCFITNIISSISCLLSLSFLVPLLVFVFSCFYFYSSLDYA